MKKTLILALAAISLSSVNAVASNNSNLLSISAVNPVEKSTGIILELTENGGKIIDNGTGEIKDFSHPGAQIEFVIGDSVSYRLITLPTGRTITKDIKKK